MSLRTTTTLQGVRKGNFVTGGAGCRKYFFLRANRRMSTFRSTLKELGFVFLNTNGERKTTTSKTQSSEKKLKGEAK